MIKVLELHGLGDSSGSVQIGKEIEAGAIFNITLTKVDYHYPIHALYCDGSLLICTTTPGFHCLRFYKQEEESKIIVMDPDHDTYWYWDKGVIEASKPLFYRMRYR